LTEVANTLFTSQPGVSRQIREVEDELGVEIFERNGKRLVGLTEPGKGILEIIERLLVEAENLQRASDDYADHTKGTLTIATTHTQARYVLPRVVQAFRNAFPDVRIALQQSSPEHIADLVLSGKADIGIATEGLSQYKDLASFACYEWSHVLVVPDGHPLLALAEQGEKVSLSDLATWPLITYDVGFTGRGHIDEAFRAGGEQPDIVLTAMDADVIAQYVALGMGVGIVASMAVDSLRAHGLKTIPASHLFSSNVTRLAVKRGTYLRSFVIDFIQQFSPKLSHQQITAEVAL
jgi:LysR family cys regulon transcriptional activator